MTPRRLQQLANVIDAKFLSGSFAKVCGPSYVVQDTRLAPEDAGDNDARLCRQATPGFEPATNTVFFYRPSWRRGPSMRVPLQADGVYCTKKVSWLAHTVGHEMVHCIVHHACPETRGKQAYVRNHGHGPSFLQLKNHIFGHDTARYKPGWSRLRPHLTVQPLQVIHFIGQQQAADSDGGQDAGLAQCCHGNASEPSRSIRAVDGITHGCRHMLNVRHWTCLCSIQSFDNVHSVTTGGSSHCFYGRSSAGSPSAATFSSRLGACAFHMQAFGGMVKQQFRWQRSTGRMPFRRLAVSLAEVEHFFVFQENCPANRRVLLHQQGFP